MKLLKRFACAFLALALVLGLAFTVTGCNVTEAYKKVYDDNNEFIGWEVDYSGYKNKLKGDIVIPAYREEKPVLKIAGQAFYSSSITSVVIPETVQEIGIAAFAYSFSLKSVTFEGNALKEIPQGCFGYCEALEAIELPSGIEAVSFMAFMGCAKLKSIVIPEGVEIVRARAFEDCKVLQSVTFPEDSLKTIGYQAFYNTDLREVTIPASVVDITYESTEDDEEEQILYGIGYAAFHTCAKLESVTILGRIETIPSGAFGYCPALKRIFLPSSLKEVQGAYFVNGKVYYGHAFHTGNSDIEIYFEGTSAEWEAIDIDDTAYNDNGVSYSNGTILNTAAANMHFNATGLPEV